MSFSTRFFPNFPTCKEPQILKLIVQPNDPKDNDSLQIQQRLLGTSWLFSMSLLEFIFEVVVYQGVNWGAFKFTHINGHYKTL